MTLPVDARVHAAASFLRTVRSAGEFLRDQDSSRAEKGQAALFVRIGEARKLLNWNPAAGRPAHLLGLDTLEGQAMAARARSAAAAHHLPELRELVVKPFVLLYAHGHDRVVLLSLKHERQHAFLLN